MEQKEVQQERSKSIQISDIPEISAQLSKEEFDNWIHQRTTRLVFAIVEAHRQRTIEYLGMGFSLKDDPGTTAQATAKWVGLVEGLDLLLQIEYGEDAEEIDGPKEGEAENE